jgi:hypothetical protein
MSYYELIFDGKVKVTLEDIGEGYEGDYNPNDPTDVPLLRMDVMAHKSVENDYAEDGGDDWKQMSDSSYCTFLPVNDAESAHAALKVIMDNVKEKVLAGQSIKKICERLSWLSPTSMEPLPID